MKQVYNSHKISIRLCKLYSLIFFALIFFFSCRSKTSDITLVWENDRAVAISVPKNLLENTASANELHVRVEKSNLAMLGDITPEDDNILFRPVVPLTRGLVYEIFFRNTLIGKIKVPSANAAYAPVVVKVYPTADTLPENLLKMYIQFSRPMREGESQKFISMLDENNDTLAGIFLDLQPELWNKERTVLTVWLDPGRIKRDLIPNQQLGNPLQKGKQYTLKISGDWKDVQGLPLQQPYSKPFTVGIRDDHSPDPAKWKLHIPAAQTDQPVAIHFGEPLDHFLLMETIRIVDEKNDSIPGSIKIMHNENGIEFIATHKWKAGKYRLQTQSILEDLAGNNLNKLFDRDITVKKLNADKNLIERSFEVK